MGFWGDICDGISDIVDGVTDFVDTVDHYADGLLSGHEANADFDRDGINDTYVAKEFDLNNDGRMDIGLTQDGLLNYGLALDLNADGVYDIAADLENGIQMVNAGSLHIEHSGSDGAWTADINGDGANEVSLLDLNGDGHADYLAVDINGDGLTDFELMDTDYNGSFESSELHPLNTGLAIADFISNLGDDDSASFDLADDTDNDVFEPHFDEPEEPVDKELVILDEEDTNGDGDINVLYADPDDDTASNAPDDNTVLNDPDGDIVPNNPDGSYDTHDVNHDQDLCDMMRDGETEKIYDFTDPSYKVIGERHFIDTDGDGKADTMIREFDSDGDGRYDSTVQYYDHDHDGTVDEVVATQLIDMDGDGVFDTYQESVDADFDGTFESVVVYDYNESHGVEDIIHIYTDIDASQYDIDAGRYDAFEYAQFDPDTVDPDAVVGDPEGEMECWEYQGNTGRCALYAQKFIIEQYTGQEVDIEDVVETAVDHGWFDLADEGTYDWDLTKVLQEYGVPVEESYNNNIDDLTAALESGKHVLVTVDADEIWGQDERLDDVFSPADGANHALDVIGIDRSDPENPMVILNDSGSPRGCGELVPLDVFADAWDDGNYYMAVAG